MMSRSVILHILQMKNALFLQHQWMKDARDDRILPNKGYYIKVTQVKPLNTFIPPSSVTNIENLAVGF